MTIHIIIQTIYIALILPLIIAMIISIKRNKRFIKNTYYITLAIWVVSLTHSIYCLFFTDQSILSIIFNSFTIGLMCYNINNSIKSLKKL